MSQDRSTFSSPSKFLSQKNKHMLAELVKFERNQSLSANDALVSVWIHGKFLGQKNFFF